MKTARPQEVFRKLTEEQPDVRMYRSGLANSTVNLAEVLLAVGRTAEARAEADRAVTVRHVLVQADPRSGNYRRGLCEALLRAGQARRAMDDSAGAFPAPARGCRNFRGHAPAGAGGRVLRGSAATPSSRPWPAATARAF